MPSNERTREFGVSHENEHPPVTTLDQLRQREESARRGIAERFRELPPSARSAAMAMVTMFALVSEACAHGGMRSADAVAVIDQPQEPQPTDKIPQPEVVPVAIERPTVEQVEAYLEEQGVYTEMESFQRMMREFDTAGFPVEFVAGVLSYEGRNAVTGSEKEDMEFQVYRNGVQTYMGASSPEMYASRFVADRLEQPPELQDTTAKITMPVYQMRLDTVGERSAVMITNWATKEVVYTAYLDDSTLHQAAMGAEMRSAIIHNLREHSSEQQMQQLREHYPDIAVREPTFFFNTEADPVDLSSVFDTFLTMNISFLPFNTEFEFQSNGSVGLTEDEVKKTGAHPIEMRGTVDLVVFSRTLTPGDPTFNDVVQAQPLHITDKYGNEIRVLTVRSFDHNSVVTKATQQFIVYPGYAFSDQPGDETGAVPLQVDFAAAGFDSIALNDYIRLPIERPITTAGDGILVYSTMDHAEVEEQYGQHFEEIAKGMATVETAFGIEPGTYAKHVMIVNSRAANAHFDPTNPETIVFRDEQLVDGDEEPSAVARHEVVHLLDNALQITEDERWVILFHGLPEKFFPELNHKRFGPEADGHAQDNEMELLASFVNTVFEPNYLQLVDEIPPEMREHYVRCAQVLTDILREREHTQNAPIIERLHAIQ